MQKTFYVDGMHCPSCELLIEKKLLKYSQVEAADASLKNGCVNIQLKPDTHLDLSEINKEFTEHGYTFGKNPFPNKKRSMLMVDGNGNMTINWRRVGGALKVLFIVIILLAAFFAVERMQLGRLVSINEGSGLYAFFLLGLVAGLSSCAALIGGLLLSLTKRWHEANIDSDSGWQKAKPHIMFHAGRLISFFILGGFLGLIGQAISFGNTSMYAFIVILVSAVMLISALQMIGISWAYKIMPRLPKFITRAASDTKKGGRVMPFITGSLTFFLPCGFTLIAQGIALTSASFMYGGLIMLYFAFGTLPILAGISWSGLRFTRRPHMTAKFMLIAGLMIVFFAIYNINGQLNVLGLPSLSDISLAKNENNFVERIVDGQQVISLVAEGFSYTPTSATTIKAGVPTKLIVDDRGILGCGVYLSARGLIDDFVPLRSGINEIDLGIPSPGTYKVTCSMGMVPPVTIKVE